MTPTEAELIDYMLFDAEDVDAGTFSRARTDEVAAHFKMTPKAAYAMLNALSSASAASWASSGAPPASPPPVPAARALGSQDLRRPG
jgi:hypothetical protein